MSEKTTAYHEAGHCVIAFLEKKRFGKVTIVPNLEEGTLGGMVSLPDPWHKTTEDFITREYLHPQLFSSWAEREIKVYLAGNVAEMLLLGRRPDRWLQQLDMDLALNLSLTLHGGGDAVGAYVDYLWAVDKDTLSYRWKAVEALAEALLREKTLGPKKVRSIIKEALE